MTTIRPTTPWHSIDPHERAALEEQTPARLQRVMYGPDVDHDRIPTAQFTADVARADAWLTELRATDTATWSGRHEYYLCDALIEWGEAHHHDGAGVWSLPVIRDLVGRYDEE